MAMTVVQGHVAPESWAAPVALLQAVGAEPTLHIPDIVASSPPAQRR
jgi:hypothetical protein